MNAEDMDFLTRFHPELAELIKDTAGDPIGLARLLEEFPDLKKTWAMYSSDTGSALELYAENWDLDALEAQHAAVLDARIGPELRPLVRELIESTREPVETYQDLIARLSK
jgi:hypothetical protein